MANESIIGIDVGTSAVKVGVASPDGTLVSSVAHAYATSRSGDTVEQEPNDWVRLIEDALAQFAAEGHDVRALGMCSQVNTHVFVDASGSPLMPAIVWQDGRASAEAAELDAKVSVAQKNAWWGTPMPIDASHALPRMLWVARHRPDVWEKTRWVLLPSDYCIWKLTGEVSSDPLSNIGLVDSKLDYIDALFDLVPGARQKMAPLVAVTDVAGRLRSGLPFAGCPLVSGTMDAWTGLVGAGGAAQRSSVYLSGTSEILGISSQEVIPTPGAIVFPDCEGIRMHAAPTQSGGDAKAWFAEISGLGLEGMSRLVSNTPRRPETPLFLPQLQGERAPIWQADLRGAFLGITRQTELPDFARAVYEGVAMAARWALETLQNGSGVNSDWVACGGNGFRSDAWNQIRADVLGKDLRCLKAGEPGILGAVTFAAIGTGRYSGFGEANAALAQYDRVFSPVEKRHEQFNDLFEIYKSAVPETGALSAEISKRSAKVGS